ncbi:DNA polymerase Y family protein [Sphingomonas sp. JC676]|uniref:Y-family DNA polymerase n=1 Tax=Sphingomonas sp. JC676 TaxID=2768065 RepID=UPI001657670C|nr:DNA polymerase Y family protein [Sphingomonas sp. JC676]MBC9030796.1 DNA polymerase Y family protein [Sphingomonas sp. JC676]
MTRVASLYLPQLPIERLWRSERQLAPPERAAAPLPLAIDDDPGACSVPRGGGWRPGARWARGSPSDAERIAALPAHQRPPMRELGRRSESAQHPFKAMRPDEGGRGSALVSVQAARGRPTVLVLRSGQREIVSAACPVALSLRLRPGMAAAHARALVGDLDVRDADIAADEALLERLAQHAVIHWTPIATVSGQDGLWLDMTGTSHLYGGEARFCRRVAGFFARLGLTARIAIAGTAGAAHALARYGGRQIVLLEPGREAQALAALPIAALRLEETALDAAARFGLERVGDLYPMPRGPLARRLGLATVTRLDQALGRAAEPIVPVVLVEQPEVVRRLLEPIATPEAITQVIADLVADLVELLREQGLGVRTAVLTAERVDGAAQHIAIGASRATRDARHLVRMFGLKVDRLEPGLGIEAMRLTVPRSDPLGAVAWGSLLDEAAPQDLAPAIDQLVGRAGEGAVFRMTLEESDVPERAVRRIGPLAPVRGWPAWKRPARMLRRPEFLTGVVALLPDHPPRRFTWRGKPYRVVAGDGPERIHGEWWRSDHEHWAVRDYFRVEVEGGERFWIFRRGDGVAPETGDLSWYLHGVFG